MTTWMILLALAAVFIAGCFTGAKWVKAGHVLDAILREDVRDREDAT
jgi:hypothetical protein